ncbi:putative lipoprotein [Mycoplasma leachii PG50]|uniref:Putative lipoprotein n=1 Tax=Mycoplasma leachii (strain DSM 21131 / NCTC 10133 / N29 / PG50) TaxID=880447 RepID=E4PSK8_MYCLG|nr:lipoprotein [Mycoplasma leachii]ADR24475.1 putative lipoprotein [Mycoplasma leachii PG50]
MKKLLTLLGSISVVASGGAVAVACGNAPTNDKIDRAEGEQADQAQKDGKAPNSGGQADQAQGDKAKDNTKDEESSKPGGSNGEQNGKQLSKTASYNLTQEQILDNLNKREREIKLRNYKWEWRWDNSKKKMVLFLLK